MNIEHISGIYQAVKGLMITGAVSINPKTAMKTTIKIFSVIAIMAFVLAAGTSVAGAQTWGNYTNSNLTCNSVTLQGAVTINPAGSPTNVWFEWGTNTSFGNTSAEQVFTSSGNVFLAVTGLTPNTTYYYRIVARNNSTGIVTGTTYSLTTPSCGGAAATQQVNTVTSNATSVSSDTVVLNGWIDPHGVANTNAWFEWGTNSTSPLGNTTSSINYGGAPTNVTSTIGNLTPTMTYYYRLVAQNANGTSYGQIYRLYPNTYYSGGNYYWVSYFNTAGSGWGDMVFPNGVSYSNTAGNANYYVPGACVNCNYATTYTGSSWGNQPIVNTYSPNVGSNYAVLNGYVNPNGTANVNHWFEWGTNQYSLGQSTAKINQTYTGVFSDNITNLLPNTTYYYRAVAQSSSGTTYGQTMNFTTTGTASSNYINTGVYNYGYTNSYTYPATSVITNAPGIMGDSVVKLSGTVVLQNNNSQTNVWFEWGQTSSLGNSTPTKIAGNNSSVVFDETLNSLSNGVTYYYRAVAQNQYGIFRGDILTFTTKETTPSIVYVPLSQPVQTETYVNYKTIVNSADSTDASKTSLVKVDISADSGSVCRGDYETFTVSYKNTSTHDLKNVVLRVELPAEVKYEDGSKGSFSEKDNTLVVDLGVLSPDEDGQVVVKTAIASNPDLGREIVVTSNIVYTTTSGSQDKNVAYVVLNSGCVSPNVALALFGENFLPNTLAGWLMLILVIMILVFLSRYLYGTYSVENKANIN